MLVHRDEGNTRREHRRALKERDRMWGHVLHAYAQRRRVQVSALIRPPRSAVALARQRLTLDRLTAFLDAHTGGRFSQEARRRGAPRDGVTLPEAKTVSPGKAKEHP